MCVCVCVCVCACVCDELEREGNLPTNSIQTQISIDINQLWLDACPCCELMQTGRKKEVEKEAGGHDHESHLQSYKSTTTEIDHQIIKKLVKKSR